MAETLLLIVQIDLRQGGWRGSADAADGWKFDRIGIEPGFIHPRF